VLALGFKEPVPGSFVGPVPRKEVSLYAIWVRDPAKAPDGKTAPAYLAKLRKYAEKRIRECEQFIAWCDGREAKLRLDDAAE
jgi:hypothetical protein